MTSPVPYGSVITSLTAVVEKMTTLPRFTCTPVATPVVKNVRRSDSKHDQKSTRAHNTQIQLSVLISVLEQATRYDVKLRRSYLRIVEIVSPIHFGNLMQRIVIITFIYLL